MQMTSLAVCRSPGFGGYIFSKEISFKRKILYPVNYFYPWILHFVTCRKIEARILRYAFAKHKIAYRYFFGEYIYLTYGGNQFPAGVIFQRVERVENRPIAILHVEHIFLRPRGHCSTSKS